jgi:single-strand DNA-binding protein
LADKCGALKKGQMVTVTGRLRVRKWEKDGKQNYATEIAANDVRFFAKKEEQDSGTDNSDIPF